MQDDDILKDDEEEEIDPLKAPILDPDALDEPLDDTLVSIDDLAIAEDKEEAGFTDDEDEEEEDDDEEVLADSYDD